VTISTHRAAPTRAAATRPSALRTLNVDTPVAAAICRSVWPVSVVNSNPDSAQVSQ
jgi:hypothetical protein